MSTNDHSDDFGGAEEPLSNDQPFRVRYRVTPDRVRLCADCEGDMGDLQAIAEFILSRLKTFGLERLPNQYSIYRKLQEASRSSTELTDVAIVEGVAPTESVDGRLDWSQDFFAEGFVYDETSDQIDYRKRAGERNVVAGQLLATLIAPIPGEAGKDFQGTKIPARRPLQRRVRVGCNIRHDEATSTYYSEIEGRIRWGNGVLAVDDLYRIEGDVGLESGDISHSGAVLVGHDVLAGTRIEAVGDVEVMGVVEAAHIQTGGALIVHGGITGAHGARIVAGGSITARYILDAHVQSGGDITVDREILQSVVLTRGAVRVQRGRIVGGKITALGGVIAAKIGSEALIKTDIQVGEDYCLAGLLEIIHKKIATTKENAVRIHSVIDPLRGNVMQVAEGRRKNIETLIEQVMLMDNLLLELREEEAELVADSNAAKNTNIIALRQLYPDVSMTLDGLHFLSKDVYTGPVRPVNTVEGLRIAMTNVLTLRRAKQQ